MASACRVVVMSRAPVPGRTMTRLIPAIGAERAATLHRAMIHRAVESALASGIGPVELWCTPDTEHEVFLGLRNDFGVTLHTQIGPDLGARMHAAIDARPGAAVVIGTDCPSLEPGDIVRASDALRANTTDAVVTPAFDGGYVLIGANGRCTALFAGVDWGSERVLAQTRERAGTAGLRLLELEARQDVDRPEDLKALNGLLQW